MSDIEVIGLGALNIDHLYRVERIIDDGEAVIEEAKSFPGGSAANTIYGLARLGVKTGFAGVVGDDNEGRILLEDFEKVGVDTSRIRVKRGVNSGSVLCLSDSLGKRSLYVLPGANNLLTIDDLELSDIKRASILHLSSFVDNRQFEVLLKLIGNLDRSVKISFSPGALYASRGLKSLKPILAKTYLLFINEREIQELTGKDFTAGAETCLEQGCHIVVVTLGEGKELQVGKETGHRTVTAVSYIRDAESEYTVELEREGVVFDADTTGAGDAFAAGFLYGLLNGKGLEECGHLGDIVAQFSITKVGARQGLPTLNELSQRYHELYNQQL